MAVDASELNAEHWSDAGVSAVAAVIPESSVACSSSKSKKKVAIADPQVTIDFGKRKRGHKDRPVESSTSDNPYSASDKMGGTDDYMDEDMGSHEGDTSSVFSSSDGDEFQVTCDEGQEGQKQTPAICDVS